MTIHRMQPKHLATVAKLAKQLGYPSTTRALRKRFLNVRKLKNRALFVGVVGTDVVGWIDLDIIQTLLHDPRIEIRALIVDKLYRGQGIGKQLLTHAKRYAKSKKIRQIFLRTNIKRSDAHRFYEREKFKRTKTLYKYEIKL